jgi:hypothetical protein
MQPTPQRSQLFVASCLALLVTSLSFGIRAGIMGNLQVFSLILPAPRLVPLPQLLSGDFP